MVNIPSTAQDLADAYTHHVTHLGLATDDPTHEATGGSYARQPVMWQQVGGGVSNGHQITFNDVPAGTYGFVLACAGPDPSDKVLDYCLIDATLNYDGQITIVTTYTQT